MVTRRMLEQLSDRQLKIEYMAAMCLCKYKEAAAILDEVTKREAAGLKVFEPVIEAR